MAKLCFFLLLYYFVCCYGDGAVKYVAIIYRHGDRTPTESYPTDPWGNESFWPVKFGELTNRGKMQHYELGKWLKTQYQHLIPAEFDPSLIYIRSTDVDRTLMSAQANLAGIFPPTEKAMWNSHLLWQPIPVHSIPEVMDEVLAMKRPCPAYTVEKYKYRHSPEFINHLKKYQPLMDYLTKYTGRKIKNYEDIMSIYSILKIETLYNFTLPNWTEAVFPNKMKDPACFSFSTATATPLMARLMVGPLLKQIIWHIYDVINEKPNHLKVSIYSGHDFTIGNILNALGVFDGQCPEYTSTIFIEYIETGKDFYIRLSYRNSINITEPYILNIPNCGVLCPLPQFLTLYEHLLSVDWKNECQVEGGLSDYEAYYYMLFNALGLLMPILLILMIIQVLVLFIRRKNSMTRLKS